MSNLDKYIDTDSPLRKPAVSGLDKYLPQESQPSYASGFKDISKRLFSAMSPKVRATDQSWQIGPIYSAGEMSGIGSSEITPTDLISGMLPYKAGRQIESGIKDVMLPEGLKSGIGRIVIDIATDPATYAGGALLGPKAVIKGGKILRSGMGIRSDSARWIKERGTKQIFTAEKEAEDFIARHLVPTVQKEAEQATTGVIRKAERMFSMAEGRLKANKITLDKTFNNARAILDNYGMLDAGGRVLPAIKNKELPRALKVIADMYAEALPATGKISGVGPTVNKGFFKFYRQMLRDTQGTAGAFKRDIQHVIEGLYDDMEKAGATGIRKAKDLFRKASQFEEEFGLTDTQIESQLQKALTPKHTVLVERKLTPILGKTKTTKILNEIKDHRVAQEFVAKGRTPMTKLGVALGRPGKQILKGFYEKRYPAPKP